MKWLLIIGGVVAALGLFLLATASGDTALFARQYPLLLGLNAALAALLAALVAYQLVAIVRRYRARVFGTRLTLRLLVRFAALAVVPGLIVYAVSVQFLTRSIESWFDVKVDAALEGGINLGAAGDRPDDGRAAGQGARDGARACRSLRAAAAGAARAPARARRASQEAVVVTASGRVLASASEDVTRWCPSCRRRDLLRQARANRGYTTVDSVAGQPALAARHRAARRARAGGRGALPAAAQQRAAAVRAAAPRRSRPPTATTASSRSRATG